MPSWRYSVRDPWRESSAVKHAVFSAIAHPSYHFRLPDLKPSTWARLTAPGSRDTIERLEFLGDSVLHACATVELFFSDDRSSPHCMTNVRSWLVSNACFQMLIEKLGPEFNADGGHSALLSRLAAAHGHPVHYYPGRAPYPSKTIADVFEVIVGAYYLENRCSLSLVGKWFRDTFNPLIDIATDAFYSFYCTRSVLGKRRIEEYIPRQRAVADGSSVSGSLLPSTSDSYVSTGATSNKRLRLDASPSSTVPPSAYRRDQENYAILDNTSVQLPPSFNSVTAAGYSRAKTKHGNAATPSGSPGERSRKAREPWAPLPGMVIIDLTLSDSESDTGHIIDLTLSDSELAPRDSEALCSGHTAPRPAAPVYIILDEDELSSDFISPGDESIAASQKLDGARSTLLSAAGVPSSDAAGCDCGLSSHTRGISSVQVREPPSAPRRSNSDPKPSNLPDNALTQGGALPPQAPYVESTCTEIADHPGELDAWYSVLSQRCCTD